MRIVIALGGNALLRRGETPDAAIQQSRVADAARVLAPFTHDHEIVICHGNGPQVGVLALESEADPLLTEPFPLDVLVAQTQGMIGYWLVQELHNAGARHLAVALVTQTVVDAKDTSFSRPTKPIGPIYTETQAQQVANEHDWTVAPDGAGWRRVVASPRPTGIVERSAVDVLLHTGVTVVCAGGGGVPVLRDDSGRLRGAPAVVDKDLTAARIAIDLHADQLVVLTDVAAVMRGFGTNHQQPVRTLDVRHAAARDLPPGSMGAKVDACGWFAARTGRRAVIGALDDAAAVLAGNAGTTITSGASATVPADAAAPADAAGV